MWSTYASQIIQSLFLFQLSLHLCVPMGCFAQFFFFFFFFFLVTTFFSCCFCFVIHVHPFRIFWRRGQTSDSLRTLILSLFLFSFMGRFSERVHVQLHLLFLISSLHQNQLWTHPHPLNHAWFWPIWKDARKMFFFFFFFRGSSDKL
jgi:hypothetical protein